MDEHYNWTIHIHAKCNACGNIKTKTSGLKKYALLQYKHCMSDGNLFRGPVEEIVDYMPHFSCSGCEDSKMTILQTASIVKKVDPFKELYGYSKHDMDYGGVNPRCGMNTRMRVDMTSV